VKGIFEANQSNRRLISFLMRHGESGWNRLNLFPGRTDMNLSGEGIPGIRTISKRE
jgi:bisphosphoglycerate-dependent phosphoglycerate mutase